MNPQLLFWVPAALRALLFAAAAGVVCLSYAGDGWAALFLAIAALNLAAGCWYLALARSASART